MSKEEYQKYVENLKAEMELIALGYRRVTKQVQNTEEELYTRLSVQIVQCDANLMTKRCYYWTQSLPTVPFWEKSFPSGCQRSLHLGKSLTTVTFLQCKEHDLPLF